MNDQFDELARNLPQSVTRRGALKKFGVGLAGAVLASLGLANKAQAAPKFICDCSDVHFGCGRYANTGKFKLCVKYCGEGCLQP